MHYFAKQKQQTKQCLHQTVESSVFSRSHLAWPKKRRRHSIEKSTGNHGFSNPRFKHIYFNGLYEGFPEFSCMFSVIFQFYKIVNIYVDAFSLPPQADSPPKGMCFVHTAARFNSSIHHGQEKQQHHLEEHDMPRFCSTQMWYSIQTTYASMHGLSWLL